MLEIVVGVLSGLSSAVVVGSFFLSFFQELKRELKKLKEERVGQLERRMDEHLNADCSQRILAKLETVLSEQSNMSAKLDRISEETAKQAAQIVACDRYITNLDSSFERHKQGGHH